MSVRFIGNTARLSGAAIYASDLRRCSWLGNEYTNDTSLIFTPPPNLTTPFVFEYVLYGQFFYSMYALSWILKNIFKLRDGIKYLKFDLLIALLDLLKILLMI